MSEIVIEKAVLKRAMDFAALIPHQYSASVHIIQNAGRLFLYAAGMNQDLKINIPFLDSSEEEFSATLHKEKLQKIAGEISGTEITIKKTEKGFTIKGGGRMVYRMQVSERTPDIPDFDVAYGKCPDNLVGLFDMVHYACASDDARWIFNGVYLSQTGDTITAAATDGRRLAVISRKNENGSFPEKGVIIERKCIEKISKIFGKSEDMEYFLSDTGDGIFFRSESEAIDYRASIIDGEFPDYSQIIPMKFNYSIAMHRQDFMDSLRRVMVMSAPPSNQVQLTFKPDGVMGLHSSTADSGEAEDTIQCEFEQKKDDKEMVVALNGNYLLDILKHVRSDRITIGLNAPTQPVLIQDPDIPEYISVVMPMKI